MAALVAELLDRRGKCLVQRAEPLVQDLREPKQERRRLLVANLPTDNFEHVNREVRDLVRRDGQVPGFVDAEIAEAPVVDAIGPRDPVDVRRACRGVQHALDGRGQGSIRHFHPPKLSDYRRYLRS